MQLTRCLYGLHNLKQSSRTKNMLLTSANKNALNSTITINCTKSIPKEVNKTSSWLQLLISKWTSQQEMVQHTMLLLPLAMETGRFVSSALRDLYNSVLRNYYIASATTTQDYKPRISHIIHTATSRNFAVREQAK